MTQLDAMHATTRPVLNRAYLPETSLYGGSAAEGIGWQLAPAPFMLTADQVRQLEVLGQALQRFMTAIDTLYRQSRQENAPVPAWVGDLYDQGKPEGLLQLARLKRTRAHLPRVLRPDLLLHDDGWTLCEIDAVPGGIGFTAALNDAYRQSGFSVLEAENAMPMAFLDMLKDAVPDTENPVIAVVLSDEAADYRAEMAWLVDHIRTRYEHIALVHPRDVDLIRDQLVFQDPQSGTYKPIDLIYRFFELFDLPNIPKIELIQYAVKKGLVQCTPPFKPHVEEKLSLALLHHPALADFWARELGETAFELLHRAVPRGWVLDPAPIPPQAVVAGLAPGGKVIQNFRQLKSLSQKERELVIKPSGFSELAWGSRGVTIGHDHSAEAWGERLEAALASFGRTPYLLQEFRPASVHTQERLNATGSVVSYKARTRLCPYYFVQNGKPRLVGALATATPADKKLIHGMKDAVLAPCQVGLPADGGVSR